jgi:hypothetical protein
LDERLRGDTVERCKIGIEHHALSADEENGALDLDGHGRSS